MGTLGGLLRLQILLSRSGSLLYDAALEPASVVALANGDQLASLCQTIRQLGNELGGAGPLQTFRVECPPPEPGGSGPEGAPVVPASSASSSLGAPSRAVDAICVAMEPNLVVIGFFDGLSANVPAIQQRLQAAILAFQHNYESALEAEVYPALGTKGIGDAAAKFRAAITSTSRDPRDLIMTALQQQHAST
jgi:hypothetical protein